jgi:hypothetical protein
MWALAAVVAAFALFLAALALLIFVGFRFYTLAITLDSAILHELRSRSVAAPASGSPETASSLLGSQLREFISSRMKPTDGEFIANTDEELFIQEQIKNLRDQGHGGLTDEELRSFVSQAVADKV